MTTNTSTRTAVAQCGFVRLLFLVALLSLNVDAAIDPTSTSPAAAKPAVAMPGTLPKGAIELLAINAFPSGDWWTADGLPAHKYDVGEFGFLNDRFTTDSANFKLYFRAPNVPAGTSWMLSGLDSGELEPFATTSDRKPAPDTMAFAADASYGTEFADLTVGIATGEWETIGKLSVTNHGNYSNLISTDYKLSGGMEVGEGRVSGNLAHGTKIWSVSMFVPGDSPTEPHLTGKAKITVVHNVNTGSWNKSPKNWAVRVIAVDQAGQEILPEEITEDTETSAFVHATYVFGGLMFSQTKEFRLQVRPFQLTEFPHVALKPKASGTPASVTVAR